MEKRYLFYTGLHFLTCLLIVKTFNKNPFIRGFLGDLFFMGLMYHSLKCLYNFNYKKLIIFLLLLAFGVEFCQYFKILDFLGLNNRVLKFLFGSTFDLWDLVAYSIGSFVVWIEEEWGK